jgi:hypothetical protein
MNQFTKKPEIASARALKANWGIVPVLSALVLAIVFVPYAKAECGALGKSVKPASFSLPANSGHIMLAALGEDSDDVSIVGMWHVVLTIPECLP